MGYNLKGGKKMEKINFEQFLERIKNKITVRRFEVEIDFKWNIENSKILRNADLSYADLSYADLRDANLHNAKGTFYFNFGVRLKIVN